jgi:chaperonin cofactor prefoldin
MGKYDRLQRRIDNKNKRKKDLAMEGKDTSKVQKKIDKLTERQLTYAELGGTIGDAPMKKDKMMKGGSLRRKYSRPRGL